MDKNHIRELRRLLQYASISTRQIGKFGPFFSNDIFFVPCKDNRHVICKNCIGKCFKCKCHIGYSGYPLSTDYFKPQI